VYKLAHTAATAALMSSGRSEGTFGTLSYSPAPDMPAKSSTLAEERQISRDPGWKVPARDLRRLSGRDRLPTSACDKTVAAVGVLLGAGRCLQKT
jgi:hypothetical protein